MTAVIPARRPAEHADEWELVDRAQAGDRAAYAALYAAHYPPVRRFLLRKLRGDEAEDLAQDVFVKALAGLGRIEYRGQSIGAWFMTIARNMAMDHFKSSRVRRVWGEDDVYHSPVPDPDPTPEAAAVAGDAGRRARAALGLLTGRQRQVLVLRYLAGLSITETAAAMGINAPAVKALTFRAIATIRRHTGELGLS